MNLPLVPARTSRISLSGEYRLQCYLALRYFVAGHHHYIAALLRSKIIDKRAGVLLASR
jgi:hypothetical protein